MMKKNDKIVVIFGVVILVLASIGVYYWDYEDGVLKTATIDDFIGITGTMKNLPDAITVSDIDPFYAVIATPLAVNYNDECEQSVVALLVKNLTDTSRAVERFINDQIQITPDLEIDNTKSAKEVSLEIAKNHWEQCDAVLLIENNEQGYSLGIAVAPIASYLSIPIIVTDELDGDVRQVLIDLGVKYSMVCGELEGYGNYIKFENIDEIVDFSIEIVREKFEEVNYISLTNPKDAWPPKVLAREKHFFEPVTLTTTSTTQLITMIFGSIKGGGYIGSFPIPKDYKYALVKFEGINIDSDEVEELGDSVTFNVGVNNPDVPSGLQKWEVYVGSTSQGGVPIRDANGKLIEDRVYSEAVLYDRGGAEYSITASGSWLAKKQGRVTANVVVEKLDNPVYPMMKGLSSMAPYLTAYRKGIIFAKPEFAFTADDHVITDKGDTCPGFYVPMRNPALAKISNRHVIEEIHDPLNEILAELAGISLEDDRDIGPLREYYANNPVHIALIGGATVIPQYLYDNFNQPVDVEKGNYYYGSGTPSDVIYGNIDPIPDDWSNLANDVYTEYPFMENIVGRITGWDVQDASALIARTVFYEEIINKLGDWKDTFGLLMGGGSDFRKPPIRYIIFGDILGIVRHGEPIKLATGYTEIVGERTVEQIAKPMGFDVLEAWEDAAQKEGFTEEALTKIKKASLLNKIFFRKHLVRDLVGEGNVKGGEIMESSNFLWVNGHGNQHFFGMSATKLTASGFGNIIIRKILEQILPVIKGGFLGPGSSLSDLGGYGTRQITSIDFGPSFFWLESCICGKIDGLYPKDSLGQSILHSGVTALVAAGTTTNIGGGYLEPKNRMYDTALTVIRAYIKTKIDAKNGIYPDPHFGYRLYTDLNNNLKEKDCSIGLAFRNAKNSYLDSPEADWLVWWSPPLIKADNPTAYKEMTKNYKSMSSSGPGPMMENKYTSYQEYILFADPAFNPYEPVNSG